MKRLWMFLLPWMIVFPGTCFAAGSVSIVPNKIMIDSKPQRVELVCTFTGDASVGGHVTATINPNTYGIKGYYLYEAVTNPGTAPDNLYDISITDADGVAVVGTLLENRSNSASERVRVDAYYPQIMNTWTVTITNDNNLGAVIVLTLRFTMN